MNTVVAKKHSVKQARAEFRRLARVYRAGQLNMEGVARAMVLDKYLCDNDPGWRTNVKGGKLQ